MSSAEKKLQQVLAQAVKSIYSAEIQPQIMQFKTNYRDLSIAGKKAEVLSDLINNIG